MNRDDVIRSTAAHIRRVGEIMVEMSNEINKRAIAHDESKWSKEEWPLFEKSTPRLASLTYNSAEYKEALADIKVALDHHYKVNSHHPEHFKDGINEMTLLDLVEMICDWKAATERHENGCISHSLEQNKERFKIEPQLLKILENTCKAKGWIK